MIVGGHKCGTTSLKEYLGAHPQVVTHPQQEFTAFSPKRHSEATETEQLESLADNAEGQLTLAKHASAYAEPFALDRLKETNPRCKVLLILRDPVARARSAFRMEVLWGEPQRPFAEEIPRVLAKERQGRGGWRAQVHLRMGLYGRWLGEIESRFPRDNVRVLFLEEFTREPASAYRETCDWLGLGTDFRPDLEARHNVGADPRSTLLSRALKRLRSEGNPAKRAARRALPEAAYLRAVTMLRNANRGTRSIEDGGGPAAVDGKLREYFEADEEELRRRLGRELPWRAARNTP